MYVTLLYDFITRTRVFSLLALHTLYLVTHFYQDFCAAKHDTEFNSYMYYDSEWCSELL